MVSPNYILLSKFEEYRKNISWKEKRSRNQKILKKGYSIEAGENNDGFFNSRFF
jgi:hypothetical protein